jgi:hypothetical protein
MYGQKTNIRSFRYSDYVAKCLESFPGNSLNEKFENLVTYCYDEVPQREKQLEGLKKEIKAKQQESFELEKKLREVHDLIKTLETLQYYGDLAARKAKSISES